MIQKNIIETMYGAHHLNNHRVDSRKRGTIQKNNTAESIMHIPDLNADKHYYWLYSNCLWQGSNIKSQTSMTNRQELAWNGTIKLLGRIISFGETKQLH